MNNFTEKYNAEHYRDPTAANALKKIAQEERQKRKRCVFICSPFAGDITENTKKAKQYMQFAIKAGVTPFAPHLLYPQVLDENDPEQRELGLCLGIIWLYKCNELWVFGRRITNGMQREIAKANKRGIPVRRFNEKCEEVFE